MQGARFGMQGVGFRLQGVGCRFWGAECEVQDAESRVWGAQCRVKGAGFGVQDAGFGVQGGGLARCRAARTFMPTRDPACFRPTFLPLPAVPSRHSAPQPPRSWGPRLTRPAPAVPRQAALPCQPCWMCAKPGAAPHRRCTRPRAMRGAQARLQLPGIVPPTSPYPIPTRLPASALRGTRAQPCSLPEPCGLVKIRNPAGSRAAPWSPPPPIAGSQAPAFHPCTGERGQVALRRHARMSTTQHPARNRTDGTCN